LRGDVLNNVGLGYAIAMGMVVIMGLSIICYLWLQRRAAGGSDEADPSLVVVRLLVGFLYFFVPLLGTFTVLARQSARRRRSPPSLEFYGNVLAAPDSGFWSHLAYSFLIGTITIIVSVGLLLPTAFWVRLRVPRRARSSSSSRSCRSSSRRSCSSSG
jgi:ABC-type spermidine/putrescine transport system permease subunit I